MNTEDCWLNEPAAALSAEGLASPDARPHLLVVDDNEHQAWALGRALEKRGYAVKVAHSALEACRVIDEWRPAYAVVDLRLPGATGLTLIPRLKDARVEARIVVLTGHASVATAVEAIKLGATHYLLKPADAQTIEAAFQRDDGNSAVAVTEGHFSVPRMEWEYIQHVLADLHGNISATARALHMHRKSLQRKLAKFPARS